jgi:hypothetical protein
MKLVFKTLLFLFLSSTFLIGGYQAVKYTRDSVRIWNLQTLNKSLERYQIKKASLPKSGPDKNISKLLYEVEYIDKEIRDPMYTSATVIMDDYAHTLLEMFSKVAEFADPELKEKMTILKELSSEAIAPDFVLTYLTQDGEYEFSTKLESRFLKDKMLSDGGNDDERFEIGSNLQLDTSLTVLSPESIKATNSAVSIIK